MDFLSIAVIVADIKEPVTFKDLNLQDGELLIASEDLYRKMPKLSDFQIQSMEFGGGGNVVLPASKLGVKTGLMGYIGDDKVGQYYLKQMQKNGVDTSGVFKKSDKRTDVSFIPKDESGKRAPIVFYEDVGRYFNLGDSQVFQKIKNLDPEVILISYSGLFGKGADLKGGKKMRDGIKRIKKEIGSLVMVDTHTYTNALPKYDLLQPILPEIDLFFCSDDEAELIFKRLSQRGYFGKQDKYSPQKLLSFIANSYMGKEKTQLFGITSSQRVLYCYHPADKKVSGILINSIKNLFATSKDYIFDTTGAGDSFKSGLCCYLSRYKDEFYSGRLDLGEVIQFANLVARLYISGPRVSEFNTYHFSDLIDLLRKNPSKSDVFTLKGLQSQLDSL